MDTSFTEAEERFCLAEMIKVGTAEVKTLCQFVTSLDLRPDWLIMQLPSGRNINQCIRLAENSFDLSDFTEAEKRFVLAEMVKVSQVDNNMLADFVIRNNLQTDWLLMQYPTGRNMNQCIQTIQRLLAGRMHLSPIAPLQHKSLSSLDESTITRLETTPVEPSSQSRTGFYSMEAPKPRPGAVWKIRSRPEVSRISWQPDAPRKRGRLTNSEKLVRDHANELQHHLYQKEAFRPIASSVDKSSGEEPDIADIHGTTLRDPLSPVAPRVSASHDLSHIPAPSDSGYQTGNATDTASLYSTDSAGMVSGVSRNFLQDFVSLFGDMLISETGARTWIDYALASNPVEGIERWMQGALKDYSIDIISDPETTQATNNLILIKSAELIRKFRLRISQYFCQKAASRTDINESLNSRLQGLSGQLSLREKVELLDRELSDTHPDVGLTEQGEDITDVDESLDLHRVRYSLIAGRPFQRLAGRMRTVFYLGDTLEMDKIRDIIFEGILFSPWSDSTLSALEKDFNMPSSTPKPHGRHTDSFCILFELSWNLLQFLKTQFDNHKPQISSMVTLSGSALYAYATTTAGYVQKTWPQSGTFFLRSLQDLIDLNIAGSEQQDRTVTSRESIVSGQYNDERLTAKLDFEDSLEMILAFDQNENLKVTAYGTEQMLVQLGQQLSWISAVFSQSSETTVSYCELDLQLSWEPSRKAPTIRITRNFVALDETEKPCWLPLFNNAVIARRFPIPERSTETGLEASIDLIAALAGVRHAVEYEDTVVLKGFSTMLIPTNRKKETIQWHLITSVDGCSPLSYEEGLRRCPTRATLSEVNLESIRNTRAIIGWCCVAETLLGKPDAQYDNIDYSGAREAEAGIRLAGGSLGFQQFGLAQLDFTLGRKDGQYHFQRLGPYRRIILASEKTLVLLYDTYDKRAWLVSASDVMLHIAQHRNSIEPFTRQEKHIEFQITDSAKESLLLNAKLNLYDDEAYCFRDMITSIWSSIEYLLAQKANQDRLPGHQMKATFQETLLGFEFKAIVEERSPFRQKQCEIDKSSGGWVDLIRDTDALVLFANGYGDVIRPKEDKDKTRLCQTWRRMPPFKDYLAAHVKTMMDLYDLAGCRLDRKFLTSTRLRWHRGKSCLFEPCSAKKSAPCHCNRLQQILPECALGNVTPPGTLKADGAVIFGVSGSLLDNVRSTKQTSKTGLYSQPNGNLDVHSVDTTSQGDTSISSENPTLFDLSSSRSAGSTITTDLAPEYLGSNGRSLETRSVKTYASSGRSGKSKEVDLDKF